MSGASLELNSGVLLVCGTGCSRNALPAYGERGSETGFLQFVKAGL